MKQIIIFILLFTNNCLSAQEVSKEEIRKLTVLTIKTEKLNLDDSFIQEKLNNILVLDKKRKTNQTIAIVLSSIAISGIVLGSALYNKDEGISEVLGGTFIGGGVVYGAISIPFWSSSLKRKKERDELIKLFH
ncbi:hypothetical protein ACQY1Q_15845 [Tenacibaculum sp. TC6]|uniref:hypothetical protein n=1 Tax=Tenacibaculum sp. TC6 TaxID=3423223 RepID=UPI003D36B1E2